MGRKPLDSEHETRTVSIRLSLADIQMLDIIRGTVPRGTYIRSLIQNHLFTPEELDETQTNRSRPSHRTPHRPRRPNHLVAVTNDDRHLHHYKRTGEPVRYDKGNALYIYVCECGAEKVDR